MRRSCIRGPSPLRKSSTARFVSSWSLGSWSPSSAVRYLLDVSSRGGTGKLGSSCCLANVLEPCGWSWNLETGLLAAMVSERLPHRRWVGCIRMVMRSVGVRGDIHVPGPSPDHSILLWLSLLMGPDGSASETDKTSESGLTASWADRCLRGNCLSPSNSEMNLKFTAQFASAVYAHPPMFRPAVQTCVLAEA